MVFIFAEELEEICKEFFDRMYTCEGQKWDLEFEVRKRDWEVLQNTKKKIKQKISKTIKKLFYTYTSISRVILICNFVKRLSKSYTQKAYTIAHHIHLIDKKKYTKLEILLCYFEFVFVSTVSLTLCSFFF